MWLNIDHYLIIVYHLKLLNSGFWHLYVWFLLCVCDYNNNLIYREVLFLTEDFTIDNLMMDIELINDDLFFDT
jgi:hypothetical protein